MAPAQASLLAKLDTQERVRDFLTNAVASGRASHAYLFWALPARASSTPRGRSPKPSCASRMLRLMR